MKKVLVTAEFTEFQKKALKELRKDIEVQIKTAEEVTEQDLREADALIGNVNPALLSDKENLQWIQLNSSGADAYAAKGVVPENTILTCATGAYGLAISEYMVGMLLVMMKKIQGYLENQKSGEWKDLGPVESPMGKRVLLVGCGNIGMEFAKRMKNFGCELVGIRRRTDIVPEGLDAVYGPEELKEQVALADVIAVSLPGTTSCYHLLDEEILKACKKGAYLINVGRGTVVDTKALQDPEIYERFAGIWLDVFEAEPLPEKDSLYFIPNLLITPHITGGYHLSQTVDNIYSIAVHNLDAWLGEKKFIHLVSRKEGYSLA